MRIMIHSNAPYASSGYGGQTRYLCQNLIKLGHQPAVSAFYGLQGTKMEANGVAIYPVGLDGWGNDIVDSHADHFNADMVISLIDIWVLKDFGQKLPGRWYPWFPLDGEPFPESFKSNLQGCMKAITMNQWSLAQVEKGGIKNAICIPHGVDTNVFKPLGKTRAESRKTARDLLKIPDSTFLGIMVAANQSYPDRKAFVEQLEAFAMFNKDHPDSLLYIHTDPLPNRGGIDLHLVSKLLGVEDKIKFPKRYDYHLGFSDDEMCKLYNAADILLSASEGEGFGIPIIEAQSCFPFETSIIAKGIRGAYEQPYSGELISIRTKDSIIETTPEHPFWTGNNWTLAKDLTLSHQLWYSNKKIIGSYYAKEGISQIYSGSIGKIASTLQNNDTQRSSNTNGDNIRTGILASATSRCKENYWTEASSEISNINRNRMGISGRIDRWRGNYFNQEKGWQKQRQQLEANNLYIQQFSKSYELVSEKNKLFKHQNRETEIAQRICTSISILDNRNFFPASIREIVTSIGNKTEALPLNYGMVSREIKTRSTYQNQQATETNYPNIKGFEPQTISEIRRRQVKDLRVYNLATDSNVYIAEGFLVHNCGLPVITNSCGGMPEITGAGWVVNWNHRVYYNLGNFHFKPSVKEIYQSLNKCYDANKEDLFKQARDFSMQYDWDYLMKKCWIPLLEEVKETKEKLSKVVKDKPEKEKVLIEV